MTTMIAGLVLFLGIHLVPAVPPLKARLLASRGERRYRAFFSACAAAGLALIIVGYHTAASGPQLYPPSDAARTLAPYAVTIAFILFASANMKTHIRALVRHPMLLGLALWSVVHLLANGDLRGTVLFGAMLAYALLDLVSAVSRHAVKPFEPAARYDGMAIAGGVIAALAVMLLHRTLFGVAAVPWSI